MSAARIATQSVLPRHASRRRSRWLLAAAVMPVSLGACSTIDEFGPRSARYNLAAVDSRSRSILTNVLRSAYGKPLQFTDLTTATGQATLGGELGLTVPFDVDPDTTARTFSGAPKASASGTSSFNVVSLNSKEFYQGLQTPISVQHIANFLASGYDPQLLLFLIISDIEIRTTTTRTTFSSNADTPKNYRLFYQAISFLREAGLSTRPGKPSAFGPFLSAADISDPKVISTLLSSSSGELTLREDPEGANTYRFYRRGSYEFCFDPIRVSRTLFQKPLATVVDPDLSLRSMTISNQPSPISGALVMRGQAALPGTSFVVDPAYFCNPPKGAEKTKTTEILISTRSVEGIFQFLGQVARQQLALQGKSGVSDSLSVMASDGSGYFVPFRIVAGTPENAALTVREEGKFYSIMTDASGKSDQTTRVLQLMTDLLAMQSSAKDLPAPNVISIIGR